RLGISAGVLTAPATGSKSTSTASTTDKDSKTSTIYGLGLTASTLNLSTKMGADLARSQLLSVLSNIQNAYQKSNAPPPATPGPGNTTASASATTTSQLASYNLALSLLNTDPNSAISNIQSIVAGIGNGGGGANDALSSLLSALG